MRGLPSLRALDEEAAGGGRARLWLALEPTDMRCGFDRQAERVRTVIGEDPFAGHGFIFRSRRGDRLKILTWDQDGFILWYKRLEVEVFKLPGPEGARRTVELRASELALILDGIDVSRLKRVQRYERQEIGAEESWQIEYLPGRFERLQHVRKKYACAHCEARAQGPQIQVAARQDSALERGLAGPGLLAYIVTSKFADYLPLYRLEDIFARQGFEIARATQAVWCGDVADLVEPLYRRMVERVRQSHVVATDDTVLPMLSAGKTRPARMWVYVGDAAHPYNVFDFTRRRTRDGPQEFLKNFTGVLLADAYGGYNGVVVGNGLTRAGCWSHARRKVIEAESTAPEIAREVVAVLRGLFAVEQQTKELSVAERLARRQAQSVPLLAELRQKLLRWKEQLLPKHPMAEAVNYTLGQWSELNVFCSDGAVPIDNNVSEREMKRVVLNRKNSLFVGNPRGGRTAAILASLTSTCRRHELDPQLYLTQLLMNLPTWPQREIDAWLPDQWKLRHPARLANLDQQNSTTPDHPPAPAPD